MGSIHKKHLIDFGLFIPFVLNFLDKDVQESLKHFALNAHISITLKKITWRIKFEIFWWGSYVFCNGNVNYILQWIVEVPLKEKREIIYVQKHRQK